MLFVSYYKLFKMCAEHLLPTTDCRRQAVGIYLAIIYRATWSPILFATFGGKSGAGIKKDTRDLEESRKTRKTRKAKKTKIHRPLRPPTKKRI